MAIEVKDQVKERIATSKTMNSNNIFIAEMNNSNGNYYKKECAGLYDNNKSKQSGKQETSFTVKNDFVDEDHKLFDQKLFKLAENIQENRHFVQTPSNTPYGLVPMQQPRSNRNTVLRDVFWLMRCIVFITLMIATMYGIYMSVGLLLTLIYGDSNTNYLPGNNFGVKPCIRSLVVIIKLMLGD